MTITSHQVRNVLRTYGTQLKRRAGLAKEAEAGGSAIRDRVEISMDARRKQVLSQITEKLISQVVPGRAAEEEGM
ncbi:MAG: hypothetical protein JRF59_04675 [Deltaproteobacteria bacterium]|nr:hypothetical protein [Deltaproteobacteria bacterium]MBW1922718.1 hypothetical protein [Deltaproteobacteria bacterium]MBW1948160.1 hypothetical protein [Deltaproteobacteria bacterium]MBW2008001.1 hypothetical protein [Deltaproteobacteria bacterium]MBW2347120.1 hypothetical protein [Deltaproteobacteria bacterium]